MVRHVQKILAWRHVGSPRLNTLTAHSQKQSTLADRGVPDTDKSCIVSKVDGIQMRSLKEYDYPGLCELSRVVFGSKYNTDYLPGWFHKVLADPNRLTCVCEKNGKVLGFAMVLGGVDEGHSLLYEAGRIDPSVSSSGLLGRIIGYLGSEATSRWPDWTNQRNCSNFTKYYDQNPDKVHVLAKKTVLTIKLSSNYNIAQFIPNVAPTKANKIIQLSREQFRAALFNKENMDSLFPDDMLVLGYNAFRPIPSNVPFITYFHDIVYINADMRHGVSVGGGVPCNDGKSWRYNFMYSGRVDVNSLLDHIQKHLVHAVRDARAATEALYINMTIPKTFRNGVGGEALTFVLQEAFGVEREDIELKSLYASDYV